LTTRAIGSILPSVVGADGEKDHDFGGLGEREKVDKSELASLLGLGFLFLFFAIVQRIFR
jgi:hypothetical protein